MRFDCPNCAKEVTVGSLKELRDHIKKCKHPNPLKLSNSARNSLKRTLLPDAVCIPQLPFVIEVKLALRSQNHAHKQHWSVHSRSVADWREALEPQLAPLMGLDLSWSHWSLTRLIPKRGRIYDFANLVGGGAKALIDTLTYFKVIHDDNPKYFEANYSQVKQSEVQARKGTLTIITLHEAKP